MQDKYNFALVTNHFSSEAESLMFGDTLKRIRSIENFQVKSHFKKHHRLQVLWEGDRLQVCHDEKLGDVGPSENELFDAGGDQKIKEHKRKSGLERVQGTNPD